MLALLFKKWQLFPQDKRFRRLARWHRPPGGHENLGSSNMSYKRAKRIKMYRYWARLSLGLIASAAGERVLRATARDVIPGRRITMVIGETFASGLDLLHPRQRPWWGQGGGAPGVATPTRQPLRARDRCQSPLLLHRPLSAPGSTGRDHQQARLEPRLTPLQENRRRS